MMGEDQVTAAAMEIKGIAKILIAHGRAFDMPAGAARSPGAVPRRFTWFGAFPESKIHGIVFAVIDFNTGTGHHVVEAAAAQFAIAGKFFYTVIHVVVDDISVSLINQRLDHMDDFRHVFRNTGIFISPADMQGIHDFKIGSDVPVGNRIPRDAFAIGGVDDLIIDISEILDMCDFVAQMFQIAFNDIPGNKRTGIAHMGMIVRCDPADIHLDLSRCYRHERFFAARERIVYF